MYNATYIEYMNQQESHRQETNRRTSLYPKQNRCESCRYYSKDQWGYMDCEYGKMYCPKCKKCVMPKETYSGEYCGCESTVCPKCNHTFGSHISE